MTYFEHSWCWTRRGVTRHVWAWFYRRDSMLGSLRWYLFGTSRHRSSPASIRFREHPGYQARCYCHEGRTTTLWIDFLGLCLVLEVSRWWMKLPCSCDKIQWLMFPDSHFDEIEEYGLERLQAEFPGVSEVGS